MFLFRAAGFLVVSLMSTAVSAETRIDGLLTVEPGWHNAIAAGQCLGANGFGLCQTALLTPMGPVEYAGYHVEDSQLLTKYYIYSEECRGAATPADIDGWCGKRDAVQDKLSAIGICQGDKGFFTCPALTGD